MKGFAKVTANLNEVKSKHALTWTEDMINNFYTLKQMFVAALCQAPPGFAPDVKPLILTIDYHRSKNDRKFRPYECNYHSIKGEMLVLVYKLTKFSHLLRLNEFTVITDSNTILHWSTMKVSGKP